MACRRDKAVVVRHTQGHGNKRCRRVVDSSESEATLLDPFEQDLCASPSHSSGWSPQSKGGESA